jgi:hypothetical protein
MISQDRQRRNKHQNKRYLYLSNKILNHAKIDYIYPDYIQYRIHKPRDQIIREEIYHNKENYEKQEKVYQPHPQL